MVWLHSLQHLKLSFKSVEINFDKAYMTYQSGERPRKEKRKGNNF